jgi:protocadherin Fat 4
VNAPSGFSINTNGVITVASDTLDYEIRRSYELQVVAKDRGAGSRAGSTLVLVTVTDINDVRPLFQVIERTVTVPSTIVAGSIVTRVVAFDPDSGEGGQVAYSITGATVPFVIDSDGFVTTTSPLISFPYTILITASDGELESAQALRLTVSDATIIDSPDPGFVRGSYSISIPEDAAAGTVIADLQATSGGPVAGYSLNYYDIDARYFQVFDNGSLVLARSLDFESQPTLNFNLSAHGFGRITASASALVSVSVLDTNDNSPVFPTPTISVQLSEGIAPSTTVLIVQATDADALDSGKLTYILQSTSPALTGNRRFLLRANGDEGASIILSVSRKCFVPSNVS